MNHHTCTACHQLITSAPVLRGNGHTRLAFHRGCSPSFAARYLAARELVAARGLVSA